MSAPTLTPDEVAAVVEHYIAGMPEPVAERMRTASGAAVAQLAKDEIGGHWAGFVAHGYWASADAKQITIERVPRLGGRHFAYPLTWRAFAQHVRGTAPRTVQAGLFDAVTWETSPEVGGLQQGCLIPGLAPELPL